MTGHITHNDTVLMAQFAMSILVNAGYNLIAKDDENHYRFYKYIDGNEFHILLVVNLNNCGGYLLRGEFLQSFDKWSNASYERKFVNTEDFEKNWSRFWIFEDISEE